MPSLQIPYAFTNNKLPVSPHVAKKGQHFLCPTCDDEVILRRGDIRVPHFAHKPDTGCSGEEVLHKTAKHMICHMYNSFGRVSIFRRCPNCRRPYESPFFKDYEIRAETEYTVGPYRADVACLKDEKLHAVIEVRDTHPVDKEKWDYFTKWDVPCIEVEAKAVVSSWQEELILTQIHIDEEWGKQDVTDKQFQSRLIELKLAQLKGKKFVPNRLYLFPIPRKIQLTTPSHIFLKPVRHNLHRYYDWEQSTRLPRIHCPECDKDAVH